ncbi:MAG: LysM peptidoglycan-binding domain-containing protein [Myxococcota bacterium]
MTIEPTRIFEVDPEPKPEPGNPPPIEARRALSAPRLLRYTVQPGDSLSGIAKGLLGDTGRAGAIFEANRDTLVDPERIEIGMVLKIPLASVP